jgi:hypothetical protein
MQTCPLMAGGGESHDCGYNDLYALVFRGGRMVFVPQSEAAYPIDCSATDDGPSATVKAAPANDLRSLVQAELGSLQVVDVTHIPAVAGVPDHIVVTTAGATTVPETARAGIEARLEEVLNLPDIHLTIQTASPPSAR